MTSLGRTPHVVPVVVAFSGGIASGKSTIAILLSEQLRWPLASFGNYVRRVATKEGKDHSRETLQAVGLALIAEGWEKFCAAVLADAGWRKQEPIIIDGVRHREALATLRGLVSPLQLTLIYVTAEPEVRRQRLRSKGLGDPQQLERLDRHPTEIEVATILNEIADLRVDGTRPAAEVTAEIIEWLRLR